MHYNKLERWIKEIGIDPKKVMNVLQEYGIISDNCVNTHDVGNDGQAMMFMALNFERFREYWDLK